ncbi:electron transfer flavoprotein-ubiquinone oxidoreductase [Acinetobacter ursingii]|uniref:electron transfer flavoprotein-ubiquinone oxidoreductase n=1 Tax=Acinetobacter ursingii TaxID=108980 RepID=UPI00124BF29F|nr:electron transfer flavoprotein-ubiquinone oxidoreductase [Acinetobacter ursingii]MDA3579177.1 electron transfer flavoprotein-ubiquinone oxidoreductase [Acinetobacter ursingii]MDG9861150.1 electron transfer flavoprotein-ubiquinone oxidoreductase [Acinetobacter ursingii]MDG9894741.1 electron transfer flavoprotein-ubiquinone oxidoreductase [Acinetobacter ursingii]MDH0008234.1 electron transfer flavoprotein-ubiquinone oxidoreductase [Acinetobacter ursingii]MDH0480016.1 electron transfer flavopr
MDNLDRESMEFDVVVVGAGPAGLSAAIKIRQLAIENNLPDLSVCVVEKGSEVGAHILSGAVLEPRAINELFPNWKEEGAPLNVPVTEDKTYFLLSDEKSQEAPHWMVPKTMHNDGNYVISLGNVVRWLGQKAEELEVSIFPGFAAAEILYHEDGTVKGVQTGDMGIGKDGEPTHNFAPGYELHAKYTLFAEGCRGHLGKRLISKFNLDQNADPQHYGIGIKELWEIDPAKHKAGLVMHGSGWPLTETGSSGGWWLYHAENNQVTLDMIVDLSYENPHMFPFMEMQRWKTHPTIKQFLEGGKRISYGARAVVKGGFNSLPKLTFPGGCLIGDDAGFLNFSKIKGSHTAMKSGMLCGEAVFEAIAAGVAKGGDLAIARVVEGDDHFDKELTNYTNKYDNSWLKQELYQARNFGSAMHKFGQWIGGAFNFIDQNVFKVPFTLHDLKQDFAVLKTVDTATFKPDYPKPDGKLTFDRLSSVFISNTVHEENQPAHLKLTDPSIPVNINLPKWEEPAQRYCPAGVYEIMENDDGSKRFQINAANCVHCKTCDIKDPSQNITWVTPEGGGGPNYPNM